MKTTTAVAGLMFAVSLFCSVSAFSASWYGGADAGVGIGAFPPGAALNPGPVAGVEAGYRFNKRFDLGADFQYCFSGTKNREYGLSLFPITVVFRWTFLPLEKIQLFTRAGIGIAPEILHPSDGSDPVTTWDPLGRFGLGIELPLSAKISLIEDNSYFFYFQRLGQPKAVFNLHHLKFTIGCRMYY